MSKNQKLELTWIGKDKQPKLEPRILIEDPDKTYGDRNTENILIFGDNLLALKALEQEFIGRIKCIFIDPPYNTGSAFTHYDDGMEHSLWLTMMRNRLEILRRLLTDDGFIFIQIDYRESARLKLLLDEVFGINCFRNEIIVGRGVKNIQSQFDDIDSLASGHDTIYLYAKNPNSRLKTLFAKIDDPHPGKWDTFWRGTDRPTMRYELFGITPPKGQWRWSKDRAYAAQAAYDEYCTNHASQVSLDVYWKEIEQQTGDEPNFVRKSPDGTVQYYVGPRNYKMLSDVWLDLRVLGKITDFPHEKHEDLLERIIEWVTNPGDFVLDSFAGSGTTGAVAHKMGRKWIMVELGDHCHTHIQPRLQKVCDGTDQGGVSKEVNWHGGGGFKYYYMAPSLLKKDRYDQWVINEEYNPTMLAAAMAKHESFHYCPDEVYYWKQGQSSEKDFIFTTTAHLTAEHLDRIHEEMQPDDGLLICCKSHFEGADGKYSNITVKKIPSMLLGKCEFDRDDYSLNIVDMPRNPDDHDFVPTRPKVVEKKVEKESKAEKAGQMNIFAGTGE